MKKKRDSSFQFYIQILNNDFINAIHCISLTSQDLPSSLTSAPFTQRRVYEFPNYKVQLQQDLPSDWLAFCWATGIGVMSLSSNAPAYKFFK